MTKYSKLWNDQSIAVRLVFLIIQFPISTAEWWFKFSSFSKTFYYKEALLLDLTTYAETEEQESDTIFIFRPEA